MLEITECKFDTVNSMIFFINKHEFMPRYLSPATNEKDLFSYIYQAL